MTDRPLSELSFDDHDEALSPRPAEQDFDRVVEAALTRRGFLGGALAFGSAAALMGAPGGARAASRFGFDPIPIATDDSVHVPEGYRWQVLARWGDPVFADAPEFDPDTRGTGASQARAFGDNTDGMEVFQIGGRQVLAVNHEYVNPPVILGNRADGRPETADDIAKIMAAHGVSVVEIVETPRGWRVRRDSPLNRRITMQTPMRIAGPAAGHPLMQTAADPTGTLARGTWNNCGSGRTPWGTYLTCEENFNGYFGSTDPEFAMLDGFARYGIRTSSRYGLEHFDARFDLAANPNEPNRAGYVVEIDPANPTSTPVKRTALGRFKHENAELVLARDGRLVVYMGDDERGEFLYRYVSDAAYVLGADTDRLLDEGTLFVAKFHDDLSGEWIALTPRTTGMEAGTIAIHTRQAASALGATTMDRPEWVAVSPTRAEAYCALTNNRNRGLKANAGGDPQPVGGPNPREANNYGQIVRWRPQDGDHGAPAFAWDLYVTCGNPTVHADAYAGSDNIHAGNLFNSPDGMRVDSAGRVWIQTDGKDSNTGDFAGMGNNQMLVGDPATGEIARFLTGPKGAEVTGLAWSADRRTLFVGIQHPGPGGETTFPDGPGTVPRSAVIAVRRDDGGVIG